MSRRLLLILGAAALALTGCGTAAHQRAVARAETWAAGRGIAGKVTCSSGFKSPAAMSARADFICLVRRSPDDCTVLHVTATSPFRVRLLHRHADCVQPL